MGTARISLPKGDYSSLRQAVLLGFAMVLFLATIPIMNTHVFPLYDEIISLARDISVLSGGVFAAFFALAARWRPMALKALSSKPAIVGALIACAAFFYVGATAKIAAVLLVGAILLSILRMGVAIMVGVALSRLPEKDARVVIAIAFLAASVLSYVSFFMPSFPMRVLFVVGSIAAFLLAVQPSAQIIASHEQSDTPSDLSAIRPTSFIPFGGTLFISMLFFVVASGYGLRFGGADGSALTYVVSLLTIGTLVAVAYIRKKHFSYDTQVCISLLLIVCGFLAILLQSDGWDLSPTALISGGYQIFELVTWTVLVSIAAKNPLDAFPVMAWGRAALNIGV